MFQVMDSEVCCPVSNLYHDQDFSCRSDNSIKFYEYILRYLNLYVKVLDYVSSEAFITGCITATRPTLKK